MGSRERARDGERTCDRPGVILARTCEVPRDRARCLREAAGTREWRGRSCENLRDSARTGADLQIQGKNSWGDFARICEEPREMTGVGEILVESARICEGL